MAASALLIALGVALLYGGGELLVRGAARLARALGLSPMVIGLTVVAFGTSAPELAAALVAALEGAPRVALGNVVGSNIANIGLILGLAALVHPLLARGRFIWREVPVMALVGALLVPFAWSGELGRGEGLLLLGLLVAYNWFLLRDKESAAVEAEFAEGAEEEGGSPGRDLLWVAAGIALLVIGAHVLVNGAVGLARHFGVGERVIGLTLVALGTSLPELAGCLVAAARRQGDIVLGNVIGSNILNVLLILGLTCVVRPIEVDLAEFGVDIAIMLFFSLLVWPLVLLGPRRLSRVEGSVLLVLYLAYVMYLFF